LARPRSRRSPPAAASARPSPSPPQLDSLEKNLKTLARTNPERASQLLQRTLDLYGQGKIKVNIEGAPVSHAGRNAIASFANDVSAAIRKADPNVMTPAPMMLAR
jgi:hypothetical protein